MIPSLPPVLAAEDEESDAVLLELMFQRSGIPNHLVLVHDGREAVSYLAGEGAYADRLRYPLPAFLLLDLKMPRMNGFDVLAWRSSRPELENLAVIVLSSSSDERDRRRALELGAVAPTSRAASITMPAQASTSASGRAPPGPSRW